MADFSYNVYVKGSAYNADPNRPLKMRELMRVSEKAALDACVILHGTICTK